MVAHQSLYRRYRSRNFKEILGQPHVTDPLRAAVAEGRQGHAYLFSGPRGTGKTSTARVLAKALNCPNVTDGEPCSECESCLSIEQGNSFDLHELDAASHNKVDDMRELISKVQLGSPGRTKVYILDEVHMLSSGAENALLKTLEEPPEHVVFVLATTEPHKVVPTIRSRTQHFRFHLLGADVLADHARWLIDDAALDVPEEAIDYIIRQGGGSARDTLSALDLVAAGGIPEGTDTAENMIRAIGSTDAGAAIASIQAGLESGIEPRTIGEDAINTLRNAFLTSMGAPLAHLNEHAQTLSEQIAADLGAANLTRCLEAIGSALVEMRQAPDPRVVLEVTVLSLCRRGDPSGAAIPVDTSPTAAPTAPSNDVVSALQTQVTALERRLAELEQRPAPAAPANLGPAPLAPTAPPTAAPTANPAAASAESSPSPRGPRRRGGNRPSAAAPPSSPAPGHPTPSAAPASPSADETNRPGSPPAPDFAAAPTPAANYPAGDPANSGMPPAAVPSPVASPAVPPDPGVQPSHASPISLTKAAVDAACETVMDELSQRARVRLKVGRVLGVDGTTVQFGLPNQIHRDRAADVQNELAGALSTKLGTTITLDLVVDGAAPAPIDAARMEPTGGDTHPKAETPAAAGATAKQNESDVIDLNDLTDAVDYLNQGIDRINRFFPGSELIDDHS